MGEGAKYLVVKDERGEKEIILSKGQSRAPLPFPGMRILVGKGKEKGGTSPELSTGLRAPGALPRELLQAAGRPQDSQRENK